MSDYKPEVGEKCEVKIKNEWEVITPKFVGKNVCVFDYKDEEWCFNYKVADYFRPTRTQEDIEREEAIRKMLGTIAMGDVRVFTRMDNRRLMAETLYDKGYRLVGEKVDFNTVTAGMNSGRRVDTTYDIYRKVVK